MINLHFNAKEASYTVSLKAALPSQNSVLIGGINYTIEGQSEAVSLFKERISGLNLASMKLEELQSRLSVLEKEVVTEYAVKVSELGPEVLLHEKEPLNLQKQQVLNQISPSPSIPGVSITDRLSELGIPGLRLSVLDDNKVWTEGFGELEKPALIQAASISKTITALTILTLIKKRVKTPTGLLTLETKVEDILDPELWKSISPKNQSLTIKQLLSHTAGLEEDTPEGYRGYDRDKELEGQLPTLDDILKGEGTNSPPVQVTELPGSRYAYSGGGAMILQKVIETLIPNKSYEETVAEKVFNPLQMTSTFSPNEALIAQGYNGDGSPLAGGWMRQPELAAAGLWSTPEDLTKVIVEVQKALKGESGLISQELARKMLQEPKSVDLAQGEIPGLGVFIGKTDQATYFYHDGSNIGYRCLMIGNDKGQGAVIMTNSDVGDAIFSEIVRTIARVYKWPGRDSLDIRPLLPTTTEIHVKWADTYEGEYRNEVKGITINLVKKGDKLYFKPPEQEELIEVYPLSDTIGLIKENQTWFPLELSLDQSLLTLTVHDMEHVRIQKEK